MKLSSNIKELACLFYKKAHKEYIIIGKSIESMVVSCLYYACRKFSVPVSFKEFINESSYDERFVQQTYKRLITTLNLKVPVVNPIVLCASVICFVCNQENRKITQTKISNVAGITEASIRNTIRKLRNHIRNKEIKRLI